MSSEPHGTLGALFVGVALSTAWYGLTCYQTFRYFQQSAKTDARLLVLCVAAAMTLQTLMTILWNYSLYWLLVFERGESWSYDHVLWVIRISAGANGITGCIVQLFFAWRVYIMSNRNLWLLGMNATLSIAQLVFALGLMIQGFLPSNHVDLAKVWAIPSFALTAAADISVTICMCITLHNRKSGIDKTDNVVNSLIFNTINNGLLTSVIALVAFVFELVMIGSSAPWALCALLGKAYTNSILSSLNSREGVRERLYLEPLNLSRTMANSIGRPTFPETKDTISFSTACTMSPMSFASRSLPRPPSEHSQTEQPDSESQSQIIITREVETMAI